MTPAHDDVGGIAFRVYGDPVFAGLAQCKGEIRRVDLEQLVAVETPHADVQRALRQLQLCNAVVEIGHGYACKCVHPNHCAADLNLGTRTRVRPEAVAGAQWPVNPGAHPIVFTGGREADRAGCVAETCNARWRVSTGPIAEGQQRDTDHEGEGPKTERLNLHDESLRKTSLMESSGEYWNIRHKPTVCPDDLKQRIIFLCK